MLGAVRAEVALHLGREDRSGHSRVVSGDRHSACRAHEHPSVNSTDRFAGGRRAAGFAVPAVLRRSGKHSEEDKAAAPWLRGRRCPRTGCVSSRQTSAPCAAPTEPSGLPDMELEEHRKRHSRRDERWPPRAPCGRREEGSHNGTVTPESAGAAAAGKRGRAVSVAQEIPPGDGGRAEAGRFELDHETAGRSWPGADL